MRYLVCVPTQIGTRRVEIPKLGVREYPRYSWSTIVCDDPEKAAKTASAIPHSRLLREDEQELFAKIKMATE